MTEPSMDEMLARVKENVREHQAHVLNVIGRDVQDKRVVHAMLMGDLQARADFLRVTYGPEKAAETFYMLADHIVAKAKPADLTPPAPRRRSRWSDFFGKR